MRYPNTLGLWLAGCAHSISPWSVLHLDGALTQLPGRCQTSNLFCHFNNPLTWDGCMAKTFRFQALDHWGRSLNIKWPITIRSSIKHIFQARLRPGTSRISLRLEAWTHILPIGTTVRSLKIHTIMTAWLCSTSISGSI